MKNHYLVSIILFLFMGLVSQPCFAGRIETDKQRWKPFYLNVNPSLEVDSSVKNKTLLSIPKLVDIFPFFPI